MSTDSSAYPDNLMGYANFTAPNNKSLTSLGNAASEAITNLLRSNPDPGLLPPLHDVGAAVASYATTKQSIDQWVFDVGEGFIDATQSQESPQAIALNEGFDIGATHLAVPSGLLTTTITKNALTGQAGKLAGELRSLIDAGNSSVLQSKPQLQAMLLQIQLMDGDPVQLAAFFQKLGPADTLLIAHYLQVLGLGTGAQKTFDTALACATQSPTWDNSFDVNLVNEANRGNVETGQDMTQIYSLAYLMQYGDFSATFLTKVGDQFFFNGVPLAPSCELGTNPFPTVYFAALSRNPEAAYSYLTGNSPLKGPLPQAQAGGYLATPSRLAQMEMYLRQFMGNGFETAPDSWMTALGQATLAADGYTIGQPPASAATLLNDLGSVDWTAVPDSFRPTVAQVVASHLDLFYDNGPGTQRVPWDMRVQLLALAEDNSDGKGVSSQIAIIEAGITGWLSGHPAPDPRNQGALGDWLSEFGTLAALPSIGPLLGQYMAQHKWVVGEEQLNTFLTWMGVVGLPFLPEIDEGGEILGFTLDKTAAFTLSKLLAIGGAGLYTKGADSVLKAIYGGEPPSILTSDAQTKIEAEMEATMGALLYAKDPSILPGHPSSAQARQELGWIIEAANTDGDSSSWLTQKFQSIGISIPNGSSVFTLENYLSRAGSSFGQTMGKGHDTGSSQYGGA